MREDRGLWCREERPAESDDADDGGEGDGDRRSQADGNRTRGALVVRASGGRCAHAVPSKLSSARWTCPTVSHGWGLSTLLTCGANIGEEVTTCEVGPSATTSPSARMTTRVATSAASSTSCVANTIACPASARSVKMAASRALVG